MLDAIFDAVLIGAGATAFLDLVSVARARLTRAPMPDYALVGRWLAYLTRGRFFHDPISKSAPIEGESPIGWIAHYLTGIAFAAILLAVWPQWARQPTLVPALIVGIGSVAAPFLLMQPGMGAGLFARRTTNPNAARLRSLITHAIFGVGLYAAGWAARLIEF
ncbi:MAG TPA: DUF2938 domain-containing protein [Pseudorhodoplanes sp.]|jgi:hypothetical protein|nr:DUF2938 domain-containing protein [Pseudorhodoplanes sp.]